MILQQAQHQSGKPTGEHAMKLVRRDLAFWKTTGNVEAIEEWR